MVLPNIATAILNGLPGTTWHENRDRSTIVSRRGHPVRAHDSRHRKTRCLKFKELDLFGATYSRALRRNGQSGADSEVIVLCVRRSFKTSAVQGIQYKTLPATLGGCAARLRHRRRVLLLEIGALGNWLLFHQNKPGRR